MKKLLKLLLVVIVLTGSGVFAGTNKNAPLTNVDKDGYVLFSYSMEDAQTLGNISTETIIIKKLGDKKKYVFADHVLSCGTHMYGYIIETPEKGRVLIKGSFTVSDNPYHIDSLIIDLSKDIKSEKLSGTITVNSRKIDYNQFEP